MRAETLTQANARLVDAHAAIPLVRAWGGGEVASADGLRFVTPLRTVNAGPNPKYFGSKRGITYYNFTSDQFTGFHGLVVPGTLRDSMFILEGGGRSWPTCTDRPLLSMRRWTGLTFRFS